MLTTYIPAGGEGSRMLPHTENTPKPLLLMGSSSRRIIDFALNIGATESDHTIVSGHYMADQVAAYLEHNSDVQFLRDDQASSCAGSILEHYDYFSSLDSEGDLLVLPSDHVTEGLPVEEFRATHLELDADLTLLTIPPKRYGEYTTVNDGFAVTVERQQSRDSYSTTGIFIFKNQYLMNLMSRRKRSGWHGEPVNTYYDVVVPAIESGDRVAVYQLPEEGYWDDAGTPDRYHLNNMRLSRNQTVISLESSVDTDARLNRCIVLGKAVIEEQVELYNAIVSPGKEGGQITIIGQDGQ